MWLLTFHYTFLKEVSIPWFRLSPVLKQSGSLNFAHPENVANRKNTHKAHAIH